MEPGYFETPAEPVNDWRQHKSLSLDGQRRSLQGWRAFAQQQLQEGYKVAEIAEVLEFVVEWSNRKEWIEIRTSGSTGRSKSIKIQKEHIRVSALRTLNALGIEPGMGALVCVPNKFIGGKMMIARAIVGDLDLFLGSNAAAPTLPVGAKIHFAALVPYQVKAIMADEALLEQWQKVDVIIVGGAAVDDKLAAALATWPNRVYETFGMTETISHIALRPLSRVNGRQPFKVLDGINVAQDERGCLVVNCAEMPQNPTITNDLIRLEAPDEFYWVGRTDNIINSGGAKVMPEAVEKALRDLINPRFFVAGLPDDKLGEKVVMVIESQPFAQHEIDELISEFKARLTKFEVPREILFLDDFEETETGKINRKKSLKKLGQEG